MFVSSAGIKWSPVETFGISETWNWDEMRRMWKSDFGVGRTRFARESPGSARTADQNWFGRFSHSCSEAMSSVMPPLSISPMAAISDASFIPIWNSPLALPTL